MRKILIPRLRVSELPAVLCVQSLTERPSLVNGLMLVILFPRVFQCIFVFFYNKGRIWGRPPLISVLIYLLLFIMTFFVESLSCDQIQGRTQISLLICLCFRKKRLFCLPKRLLYYPLLLILPWMHSLHIDNHWQILQ